MFSSIHFIGSDRKALISTRLYCICIIYSLWLWHIRWHERLIACVACTWCMYNCVCICTAKCQSQRTDDCFDLCMAHRKIYIVRRMSHENCTNVDTIVTPIKWQQCAIVVVDAVVYFISDLIVIEWMSLELWIFIYHINCCRHILFLLATADAIFVVHHLIRTSNEWKEKKADSSTSVQSFKAHKAQTKTKTNNGGQ